MKTSKVMQVLVSGAGALGFVGLLLYSLAHAPETYPWGDTAVTSIYTIRAARGELLVGTYSRFGWNHPGPILYDVLAPLYALSGYREISLKWTALMVNLAALGSLLTVARNRAPGLALAIAMAILPLIWREQRLLFNAWNPMISVLPFTFAVVLAAAVAAGAVKLLPLFTAVASFVAQAHVGYAGVVTVLALLCGLLFRARNTAGDISLNRRELFETLLFTAGVLAALWIQPLIEELRGRPGNAIVLLRFFIGGGTRAHPSWPDALMMFSRQLLAPFSPGWEPMSGSLSRTWSAPLAAIALLELGLLPATALIAGRRRNAFVASFSWLCLAASVIGLISVKAITGPVSDYLIFWVSALGAFNLAAIGWMLAALLAADKRINQTFARAAVIGFVLVMGVVGAVRLQGKHASDARITTVRALAVDLDNYCRRNGIRQPFFDFAQPAWQEAMGIVLHFYKERRSIAVADDKLYRVGVPFRRTGREDAEFLLMPTSGTLPRDVVSVEWVTTHGIYRIVRVCQLKLAELLE